MNIQLKCWWRFKCNWKYLLVSLPSPLFWAPGSNRKRTFLANLRKWNELFVQRFEHGHNPTSDKEQIYNNSNNVQWLNTLRPYLRILELHKKKRLKPSPYLGSIWWTIFGIIEVLPWICILMAIHCLNWIFNSIQNQFITT